ncbi:MAG TPA: LuxR C-terminal-related transcriptional regulator [Streptosporangiaceae bacterium]|nr:LuxR C-terminal-related transcriptional regulator [Streptosporangiaceae bacterium]
MARPARRTGNLPAETSSFIGRRRELAEVRKRLTEARLVTLTGPGGVGKTRLAVRAATDLVRGFRGGGWLVELAEVGDPALVSNAVMAALDLRDQASADPEHLLLSYLADKELLLVVDNCEHLLGAVAALVTGVMKAAPGVRVVATSREPLAVPGEHVVPVPPFELPAPQLAGPLARLAQNEAVMLFVARAAAASGMFELTPGNQAAVADLCRRLDGLPLAIELAAVRTRVLTPQQLLQRLSDRFGLLSGGGHAAVPRQATLRTTIEWSHDLLTDAERAVLRRTCVFAGRFALEDAESVCTSGDLASSRVLDLLSSLVDKSLVVKEDAGDVACYRLHESMREFARLKLREAAEEDAVELRCAQYYQSECGRPALAGERLDEWLAWVGLEIDNIRAVLAWCLARADVQHGTELARSLGWYWMTHATTEGSRWLSEFLALDGATSEARAWALFMRGFLGVLKADPAAARPALRAAVAAARELALPGLLTQALCMGSVAEDMAGDHAAAWSMLDEAQLTTADAADVPGRLAVLQARSLHAMFQADLDTVLSASQEGERLARKAGDFYRRQAMLINLATATLLAGRLDQSAPLLAEALQAARQLDDRVAQFHLVYACGCHATLSGRPALGAKLFGAADTMRSEVDAQVMQFAAPFMDRVRQDAAAALGAAKYAAELEAGKRLDRDAAVGLALGQPARAATLDRAGTGLLGEREAEVARLVAEGLTNKEIGTRLFISERTVDSHVRAILNKLGFSSRAQIAAWVAAAG